MSRVAELLYSRRVPQVAVLALMSFGFAGCSADMQSRLSHSRLQQSFRVSSRPPARCRSARRQRELPQYARPQTRPQYQSAALPPPISAPQSYPVAAAAAFRRRRGVVSYAPPVQSAARDHRHRAAALGRSAAAGRRRAAPRSSSAPAIRWNACRAAIASRPPRSCRPTATRVRARLSPGQQLIIPHPPRQRLPLRLRRPRAAQAGCSRCAADRAFTSSIAATRCSASRATTTFRSASLPAPTTSTARPSSTLGMKLTVPGTKTAAAGAGAAPCRSRPLQPVAAAPVPRYGAAAPAPVQKLAAGAGHANSKSSRGRGSGRKPRRQPARCRHSAGRCAAR